MRRVTSVLGLKNGQYLISKILRWGIFLCFMIYISVLILEINVQIRHLTTESP